MKAHQLDEDGVIVNTIMVLSLDAFPNLVDADLGGRIGDSIIDGVVVPQDEPGKTVPESVPMLNATLVLIGAGYLDDVESFIAHQGPVALAFWKRAQTVRRDNVLVNAWAAARGKSKELDDLFIDAGALNPDEFHG